ncbi:MAG: tetratricopeptide repeat protein [Alphaproteobacteria bacterium]
MNTTSQPSADAMRRLAALYNEGRHVEAEVGARKLLARHPRAVLLYDILAAALAGQGKITAAVEACRAAIRIRPDHVEAYSNMGTGLRTLGRLEESVAACREALRLRPDHVEARNNLAIALQGLGRFDEAIENCRMVIRAAPDFAAAHSNLGAALRATGDLDGAIVSYRAAVRLAPKFAAAHSNLGVALRESGRLEEAVVSCRAAVELRPDYAEGHNNLGIALRQAGRVEDAIASYRRAVALRPDYAEAHNNLANALHDLGKADEAVESYREALLHRPDHARARHMLAALTGETTKTAPPEYTVALFDGYAPEFDRHLVKALKYEVPARLADLLRRTVGDGVTFERAIDLGCGTGLSGEAFRPFARYLAGVDLSGEMIKRAREKGVYEDLMQDDVIDALGAARDRFNLFVCTDVLIYIGGAADIFAASAAVAAPGALFCVSTEFYEGEGYVLRPTGRYAHADTYMCDVATAKGFVEIARETTVIREEKMRPIEGRLFLFRWNVRASGA